MQTLRPWALVLLCVFVAHPVFAVDPALPWFTIETEHFRIHFHEGPHQSALALRVARNAERAQKALHTTFRATPVQKTEVLLLDDVDGANGSAQNYLRPEITLLAEPPDDLSELGNYDDWVWSLVSHEYTHIIHFEIVRGVPRAFNRVFGKIWTPNAYAPRWVSEGLATYQETRLSSAGRNRSSLFDMTLRATFLEGVPFRLDEITHTPTRVPRGALAYLHGGRFLQFIGEKHGEDRLRSYFEEYGGRIAPFALNASAELTLGQSFLELWEEWMRSVEDGYRKQLEPVRRAGLTPYRELTHAGQGTGQPRFSHDGRRLFYVEDSPDRRTALRSMALDGSDDRLEFVPWGSLVYDLSPDDRRIVFAAADRFEQMSVFDDLYELDRVTGEVARLSHGLRATEPSYHPEGRWVVFVGRDGSGNTYLGLFDLSVRRVTRLYEADLDHRVFTPIFDGKGEQILFSQQSGSSRFIRCFDLRTRLVTTLSEGPWQSLEPSVGPGGQIWVTSDRTGIYNLHTVDLENRALVQRSNLETGAFQPRVSPDGTWVAFSRYSARGYDVALMPAAPQSPLSLPDKPPPPTAPALEEPRGEWRVRPYSPFPTLLPQYWLPVVGSDPLGLVVGAQSGGSDAAGRHAWAAQATLGTTSAEPGGVVSYSNHTQYPTLGVAASTRVAQARGFLEGLYDRQWALSGGASVPVAERSSGASIEFGYEWRHLLPRFRATFAPDLAEVTLPSRGTAGDLSIGVSFGSARGSSEAISAEEGHSLGLQVHHSGPETFGSFRFSTVTFRHQTYLLMPWSSHHVLAAFLFGGVATGDLGGRAPFGLGGVSLQDPVLQLLGLKATGSGNLRGYRPDAFFGKSVGLASLEYRFPAVTVDRGPYTLPVFLRRIHGAVFSDLGATGPAPFELSAPKPSAGLEARFETGALYSVVTNIRLGLARGFAPEGIWEGFLTAGGPF